MLLILESEYELAGRILSCPYQADVGHVTTTRNSSFVNISPSNNSYKNHNIRQSSPTAVIPNRPHLANSPPSTVHGTILLPTPPSTPLQSFQPPILPLAISRSSCLRPQHSGSSPVFLPIYLRSLSISKQRLWGLRRSSASRREWAHGRAGGAEDRMAGGVWDGGV